MAEETIKSADIAPATNLLIENRGAAPLRVDEDDVTAVLAVCEIPEGSEPSIRECVRLGECIKVYANNAPTNELPHSVLRLLVAALAYSGKLFSRIL